MKISYNAPVVLTFALLSLLELILGYVTHGTTKEYFVSSSWTGSVLYVLGHSGLGHYLGNMTLILLLGPALEERYGSLVLLVMIFVTAILTASVNAALFDHAIIGASGIVFMMIVLSSMATMKSGTIHLTFVLVVLLYVGGEMLALLIPDDVSHFAHIFGGIMGGVLGVFFAPIRPDPPFE